MREKSNENWRVGNRCLQDGDLNAATSRLYYGVCQAVLAWARAKKGYTKTVGIHGDMCRFVQTEGKARNLYGPKFVALRGLRETADYQPDSPDLDELHDVLDVCGRMRDAYLKMAETP